MIKQLRRSQRVAVVTQMALTAARLARIVPNY